LREKDAIAAAQIILALAQACLRRLKTGAVVHCFHDNRIELWRFEKTPPIGIDLRAGGKMLRCAACGNSFRGVCTV
jgi:hypothetical protein